MPYRKSSELNITPLKRSAGFEADRFTLDLVVTGFFVQSFEFKGERYLCHGRISSQETRDSMASAVLRRHYGEDRYLAMQLTNAPLAKKVGSFPPTYSIHYEGTVHADDRRDFSIPNFVGNRASSGYDQKP